ncbi:hypothetical protein HNY73_007424 [Argiope bruennichi]|uniref:Uncharacterized protein n=1 Tax=Argiope bruennichi TaxID=94029 RepID=A0A8T0FEU6_ARGBR|nr:hypothetical protein HNY73_007424 [Argiope bruennichi]
MLMQPSTGRMRCHNQLSTGTCFSSLSLWSGLAILEKLLYESTVVRAESEKTYKLMYIARTWRTLLSMHLFGISANTFGRDEMSEIVHLLTKQLVLSCSQFHVSFPQPCEDSSDV